MSNVKMVVNLNGFVRETDIVIIENDIVKTKYRTAVDGIANSISELTNNYSVNKLYLYGFQGFCDELSSDIQEQLKTKYDYNNLEIEVITK